MAINNAINRLNMSVVTSAATQQMENNVCYIFDTLNGNYTLTLPVTSEAGSMLYLVATKAINGLDILQNANQYICANSSSKTTVGVTGSVHGSGDELNPYNYFSLLCIEKDKGWIFAGYQANITVDSFIFI